MLSNQHTFKVNTQKSTMSNVKPESRSISDLLGNPYYKYVVPKYQRGYAWGSENILQLLDDLSEDSQLYLGTMVLHEQKANKNLEKKEFHIVDGQQRLTNISLLLIAIREFARTKKFEDIAWESQGLIRKRSHGSEQEEGIPIITVSKTISRAYEKITSKNWDGNWDGKYGVDNVPIKREENILRPLYNEMFTFLKDNKYSKKKLMDLYRSICNSYVTVFSVSDDNDVFVLFERLNNRGMDLNVSDLLKNHIFSKGIAKYEEKWMEIVENSSAQTSNLQRMLKYFYNSRKGYVQRKKLYGNLKKYSETFNNFEEFVDDLLEFSKFNLLMFERQDHTFKDKLKIWLIEFRLEEIANNDAHLLELKNFFSAIKLFGVTQALPVIFSLFHAYRNSIETGKKNKFSNLRNTLKLIENYHFINNVIAKRANNKLEKEYGIISEKLYNNKIKINKYNKELLLSLKKLWVTKEEFIESMSQLRYEQKTIPLIYYIFQNIENSCSNRRLKGADIFNISPETKGNYSIEHIEPQSTKNDLEEFDYIDALGNLIILSRHGNSSLGNKSPSEKFNILKIDESYSRNLNSVKQFIKKYSRKKWNETIINKRTRDISIDAYTKLWGKNPTY